MTKIKSKKMNKSTIAIIVMAIAMVALLAFGGTYAYFTATAKNLEVNNLKTGTLKLDNMTTIQSLTTLDSAVPGEYFFGSSTEKQNVTLNLTDTDVAAYVFVKYSATTSVDGVDGDLKITEEGEHKNELVALSDVTKETGTNVQVDKWVEIEPGIYAAKVAKDAETDTLTFSFSVQFNPNVKAAYSQTTAGTDAGTITSNTNAAEKIMGATLTVTLDFYAIQADPNISQVTALAQAKTAFGLDA